MRFTIVASGGGYVFVFPVDPPQFFLQIRELIPKGILDMSTTATSAATLAASESLDSLQLVSFRLGQELFGIEITKVREIILLTEITRIPQAESHVKGVINLRNMVIPVIDPQIMFGLPESSPTEESRIMVLQSGKKTVGIIVDSVSEVLRAKRDQIAPPPPTVSGLGREYLNGLVKLDRELLILLDIEKLLADRENLIVATAS